ncbi:MAG: DUF2948 family protein [Holosporaceae bacterium]|jgi:hypothetical protein|nr:DUF2948 family protein [Holosporaceae bacterium]
MISIKARNFEESDLISCLIQDSILHFSFHSYHPEKRCLRFMLNRFCWELKDSFEANQCYYRVHSGLYIHNVESIFISNNLEKVRFLNLLTFHAADQEINMIFSEKGYINLKISGLNIYLKDLHEKYPTAFCPLHTFAA